MLLRGGVNELGGTKVGISNLTHDLIFYFFFIFYYYSFKYELYIEQLKT